MSVDHSQRRAAEDHRNEAALRVRVIADHEQHARDAMMHRLLGALIQRPEPHHFHECPVTPLSPRRGWGWPDIPGGTDSTGFCPGGIV